MASADLPVACQYSLCGVWRLLWRRVPSPHGTDAQIAQEQGEKAEAVFAQSSVVYTATGETTGISLRFPVFVDDKAKSLKSGDTNAQPPFADIPGYAYAYEVSFGDDPAYVYFAAVKVDEKAVDALEQEVQAAVGKVFSGAAWQDVTIEKFQGRLPEDQATECGGEPEVREPGYRWSLRSVSRQFCDPSRTDRLARIECGRR